MIEQGAEVTRYMATGYGPAPCSTFASHSPGANTEQLDASPPNGTWRRVHDRARAMASLPRPVLLASYATKAAVRSAALAIQSL